MKEQDQIRAIAELDGWEYSHTVPAQNTTWGSKEDKVIWKYKGNLWDSLPNYLRSYDAIIPVMNRWCSAEKGRTYRTIEILVDEMKCGVALFATPSQLCQALLRAAGRWYD